MDVSGAVLFSRPQIMQIDGNYYLYSPTANTLTRLENVSSTEPVVTDSHADSPEDISQVSNNSGSNEEVSDNVPKNSDSKQVWSENHTKLLIEKLESKKNCNKNKNQIYLEISREMFNEHGYVFTIEQINNRIKTLSLRYKGIKDHNAKSGNDTKTWKYYDLMENYFGDRAGITPVASCSSLSHRKDFDEKNKFKPKIKASMIGTKSPRQEMLKWLKEYKRESDDRENKRVQLAEKQHQENQTL